MTNRQEYKGYYAQHFSSSFSVRDLELFSKVMFSIVAKSLSLLPKDATRRILDIGSGLGGLAYMDVGFETYVGLELDPEAVSFASAYFGSDDRISFYNTPIEQFKTDRPFTTAFAFEVLEHVQDPDFALSQIRRLISADRGYLVATSPFPYRKNIVNDPTHRYVLHPQSWYRLLNKNGFDVLLCRTYSFIPALWRLKPSWNLGLPLAHPFPGISTSLMIARA